MRQLWMMTQNRARIYQRGSRSVMQLSGIHRFRMTMEINTRGTNRQNKHSNTYIVQPNNEQHPSKKCI